MVNSDFRTPTWGRLTQLLQDRLLELREFNDMPVNDPIKTALIRGQISEVKRLLALSQDSARADDIPFIGDVETSLE